MKRIGIVSVLAMFACAGLSAGDLYVGPDQVYTTIQAAVDDAQPNDVIHVAEGVYDVGGADSPDGADATKNRVLINSKSDLTICGAGKGKTIIRGTRPTDAGNAPSTTAISGEPYRCVRIKDSSNIIVRDLTLERGEAKTTNVNSGQSGGGVYITGSRSTTICFVGCAIRDCAAVGAGAANGGVFVRCEIENALGGKSGAICQNATLVNSVAYGCYDFSSSGTDKVLFGGCKLYNCTVADNYSPYTFKSSCEIYNSVVILSADTPTTVEIYNEDSTAANTVFGSTAGHQQIMGPLAGDFHLLPTSAAIGAGLASHLEGLTLPDGIDAFVDYEGRPIAKTGTINAGALQTVGVPAAGALVLTNAFHRIGGHLSRNAAQWTWVVPAGYPVQYRVSAVTKNGRFFRWQRSVDNGYQYASMDGTEWLMPPPDSAAVSCYTADSVNDIYYVAEDGDDATGKVNDESKPYASLAAAVEAAGASYNRIILVKPGYYTNKTAKAITVGSQQVGADCRFATQSKKLLIRSTGGAGVTFIGGAPCSAGNEYDAVNYPGAGSDAIRIAYMRFSCALQGFTLMNSYATGADVPYLSASTSTGTELPQILDCVISNCVSTTYGTSANCTRCRFGKIVSARDVVNGNTVFSFVTDCDVRDANYGAVRQLAVFCTSVGEPNVANLCTLVTGYNSIWDGAATFNKNLTSNGCLLWNYAKNTCSTPYLSADPVFVDRGNAPTLGNTSPAVGAGIAPTAENCATTPWYVYCVGDLNNEPIRWTDGKPTIGAAQKTVPCVSIAVPANGGVTFEGAPLGISPLDPTKTIVAKPAAGARPCAGITVNGEPLYFTNNWQEATSEYAISVSEAGVDGLVITALYSNDWYADDDGNDANSGFLPKLAKKTLATAEAMLAGGDTLWVLPGTYDTGSNRVNATETIWSRLVVQNGHTVVSTDGPEQTVIVGADATIDPDDYGCGTNAIRCAMVCRNGMLSGFTLTGGRVNRLFLNKPDGMGAGVIGESSGGTRPDYQMRVENCIISNCVAAVGAGATRVQLVRSRVFGNRATSYGTGTYQACQYGCLFAGNVGNGVVDHSSSVIGCTVAADNLTAAGAVATALQSANGDTLVANTLFCGPISHTSENALTLSHCAYPDDSTLTGALITITDCVETNVEALAIDGAGVPVVGSNAAIDKGDPTAFDDSTYAFLDPEHDLYGFQRVMNGAMDIGCCEGDWRRRYTKDIGKKGVLDVTAADAQVVDGPGRAVTIPSGSLFAALAAGTADYRVRASVSGTGVLEVFCDGTETPFVRLVQADGEQDVVLNGSSFEFRYEPGDGDTGSARIAATANRGMMLIFR